jgi:DNA-binding Xre family transcriptional regulator
MAQANTVTTPEQTDFAIRCKVRLAERRLTVTELAKRLDLARNTVSLAIHHPTLLAAVRARITKELGL